MTRCRSGSKRSASGSSTRRNSWRPRCSRRPPGTLAARFASDRQFPSSGQEIEMSLTGKVAVVTGAANDIGVAVVQVLAERGARVLAVDDDLAALSTLAGDYVATFAA